MPSIARPLCVAIAAAAGAMYFHAAVAQELMSRNYIKPGEETFTLNLGGILNQFDTNLTLNGQTHAGSDLGLESNGLDHRLSSFEASGTWRFLSRNRIDIQYFSANRSGSRTYDSQITIGDTVFPVGATVMAEADDRFLLADYRYSFVKTDAVEIAGLIGLYGGKFDFKVNATGVIAPNVRTIETNASTTVPLPLVGATVDWYVNPQWKIAGGIEGMKAKIGDVDGSVFVATAATEYMLVRNFGVGLRYMYSNVDVDVTKSSFNGNVTWRMNSVSLYAKMMF